MHNSFGKNFCITSFGESHGRVIGIIVDGCPPGIKIEIEKIQKELDRRRPGQSSVSTSRKEEDRVKILSGLLDGYSTGAPICMIIENKDIDSSKYELFKNNPRPSHADYPAIAKFGKWVDIRGSGRFSGRNTAGFVMAGSIAKIILDTMGIKIAAYSSSINIIKDDRDYSIAEIENSVEKNSVRTPDPNIAELMEAKIIDAKNSQDSIGGIITCKIEGISPGIGDPMFDSLESRISAAIFSVPAVRGVEFGTGFKAAEMLGSQHNDPYEIIDGKIVTKTNHSGGIIGGISNGMPIIFNTAIKPTASIAKEQKTIDLSEMENSTLKIEGRHDPCIVPRAVPVIEAMTAVVLADVILGSGQKIGKTEI